MSKMLGRSRPFDLSPGCCKKHGGQPDMSPKRRKEERDWRKEAEKEVEPDAVPGQG
jgi:hypothetical protein